MTGDRDSLRDGGWDLRLTDITGHLTDDGKLYLRTITDIRSNRIVGFSIDSRMKASSAVFRDS
ncbi:MULTISPECIES: hypothetical protein [unclassified Rhodococcus (in: high G+C Gram-positive bacteria)]|uniref:hypothetical protein n=1 Tax=unclassified Rhodococcus (in: high G+C Gram-positive bacteria) TaxID=192944 RepID=UPI000A6E112B|nr:MULTISPECIES: hypothetical protein [unclassified Rhodococcus (in: high G+C Gram-positive bacteria)]